MKTLWTFKTARFTVTLFAHPCEGLDLSWDESGEVMARIESGVYGAFDAELRIELDGETIESDWLGDCIEKPGDGFYTRHRDPDPMNRNCSEMRATRGSVSICHYFPDMVRTATQAARLTLAHRPAMRKV